MKEAVIVSAVRTPLGSFNGTLANVGTTQLGALVIEEAIDRAGIPQKEVNEAFSGSTVAVLRELGLDPTKVNVNGGSVALGHPIGASGCRVLVTLLYEMIKQNKKTGLASLCLGGGEAVAMIVNR